MTALPIPHRTRLTRAFLAIAVGVACLAAADLARAEPHEGRHDARIDKLLDRVDATAEQRARIAEIIESARADRPEHAGQRRDRQALREALQPLLAEESLDRAAVRAVVESHRPDRAAMADDRLETLLDIAEVLTPEQRLTLLEAMGSRGRGHRE